MKPVIVISERGYIDTEKHRRALADSGSVSQYSVVRFYFGPNTWIDIKFDKDTWDKDCLRVRAMSYRIPSLTVQPESGNTLLITPVG